MSTANNVTAGELAGITLADTPAASSSAPAPAAPTPAPAAGVERDVYGRAFDAGKFRHEKDTLGRWKNLRGGVRAAGAPPPPGRKPDMPPPPADPSFVAPDPVPAPPPPQPTGPDKYDLSADVFTRSFYAAADSLFSGRGEWAPDNDEEHTQLRNATAAYMRAKGLDDLPPGAALVLAVGTYVAKRIQRPNTNTRWRMIVAYWRARMQAWRSGRRINNLPHVEMPAN